MLLIFKFAFGAGSVQLRLSSQSWPLILFVFQNHVVISLQISLFPARSEVKSIKRSGINHRFIWRHLSAQACLLWRGLVRPLTPLFLVLPVHSSVPVAVSQFSFSCLSARARTKPLLTLLPGHPSKTKRRQVKSRETSLRVRRILLYSHSTRSRNVSGTWHSCCIRFLVMLHAEEK